MKTLRSTSLILAILIVTGSFPASANDHFVEAMQKSIGEIYHASSIEQYQIAVNKIERIGAAEKTRWEPFYYAGFGYIMMANLELDARKKDQYLDQALASVGKAKNLVEKESEVIALEGFVFMMRVTIDPASRGAEFAPRAMETFAKALALNPENPRAMVLSAQMQYGTAQFFGSSTQEPCENVKKAMVKFNSVYSSTPLAPQWGKAMAESLAGQCN